MPDGYAPYIGNWRNIRPETYKDFDAFIHVAKEFAGRICFPIYEIESGRIVAFQSRTQTDQTPKYLFTPRVLRCLYFLL